MTKVGFIKIVKKTIKKQIGIIFMAWLNWSKRKWYTYKTVHFNCIALCD